jgi:endonuclease YncB( thermonuclease family)
MESELFEQFKNYDISTPHFSLNGMNTYGRLVDIYDGDTVRIILPLFESNYFKFDVRLNGIDTCEIKSHNPENKEKALKARSRVCDMVEEIYGNYVNAKLNKGTLPSNDVFVKGTLPSNDVFVKGTSKEIKDYLKSIVCIVFVKCYDFDKYGRLLADVYIDHESVNRKSISEILLSEKLAYPYNGGTKLTEEEQLKITF